MSGSVVVVVPWRGGCPHRERALDWVLGRYLQQGLKVRVEEAPAGLWRKAIPVWRALQDIDADIVVVADADVFCGGIAESVAAVENGANWSIPHRDVFRLSQDGTARLYAGEGPEGLSLDQRPYRGLEGGGIVVARRDTLLEVPMDPRFVGWGQEDHSYGMALHTLCGPAYRFNHRLYHLWHPHPARMDRKRGSPENWALFRRYCKARQSCKAMEALIGEAIVALNAAEHSLHADSAVHL